MQLAHACLADGFDHVIPAAWGDELVAAHVIDRAGDTVLPVVQCSCPRVAERLCARGNDIEPLLLRTIAPSVALARHLRAAYAPAAVSLTFVGGCPAARAAYDACMDVGDLLVRFDRVGLALGSQPTAFDSTLSPDRRRFWSVPGGAPDADRLAPHGVNVERTPGVDVVSEVAEHLLSHRRLVVDVAAACGCSCSGSTAGVPPAVAQRSVEALEPPRAGSPVVEPIEPLALSETLPVEPEPGAAPSPLPAHSGVPVTAVAASATLAVSLPRRRSGDTARVFGAMPLTRRERGRHLPRAYIARRRSSPQGLRAAEASSGRDGRVRTRVLMVVCGTLGLGAGFALAWVLGLVS